LSGLNDGQELPGSVGDFARQVLVLTICRHCMDLCDTLLRNPFATSLVSGVDLRTTKLVRGGVAAIENLTGHTSDRWNSMDTHPTVECHMYLALMILHTPRTELLDFAHSFNAGQDRPVSRNRLREWMQDDEGRTARTAVAYAGVLLAYLRRKSFSGFYDPVSVVMAVLVLWTYNQLGQEPENQNKNTEIPELVSRDNKKRNLTVRLDRIAQSSIHLAEDVKAWRDAPADLIPSLTGVANICRPSAGIRLLEIGIDVLNDFAEWGLSQGLLVWLSGLRRRCKR
jgi:hypothetical protein